ncbi:DUF2252 domain-containing protein [Amycolatopsis acidicola]|uniref:DUF2252 domain-containing protein n=1 Tax=Amycolatopsis acidicola TaxID=2596893 RepID=A0A5N0VE08_9PSEU|nr:DUF2252 domain-containing protein [Amycolatopsis acidicola]KAA9163603.1 DUF2252 domain-containing protein [Amycolatopsis acidicola]
MTAQAVTPAMSRDERIAQGKAARARVPRSAHAGFVREEGSPAPLELLARQDEVRVPELVPIRYKRMAESPFAYYRGAALPMAHDLAPTPRTGFTAQACGDAHLANFGLFASPERRLVFDINDFDETLPGPWEWDVKRLAASLEVAARDNGFSARDRDRIVLEGVGGYRNAMREFAGRTALDVWYAHADVGSVRSLAAPILDSAGRKQFDRTVAKAKSRDNAASLVRFTATEDGTPRITSDPPRVVRVEDLAVEGFDPETLYGQLNEVLRAYRRTLEPERRALLDRYTLTDIARMIVGVGSVGTRCWMLMLLGGFEKDALFLQAKEASRSVLEEFAGKSEYANHGQRVIVGQRLMQTVSDIFLGWVRVPGIDGAERDFYVRQLRDGKGSVAIESLRPTAMATYGRLCGWTLARAHARSGDGVAIAAYLGSGPVFDHAVREFAVAYADQNELDHSALRAFITRKT